MAKLCNKTVFKKIELVIKSIFSGEMLSDKLKFLFNWFLWILHAKLGMEKSKIVSYMKGLDLRLAFNSFTARFRTSDKKVAWLWVSYMPEPCVSSVIVDLLKKAESGSIFLDVGAHIGRYSIIGGLILKKVEGYVYAFEPVEENFLGLLENIKLNDLDGVVIPKRVALSDTEGFINIKVAVDRGSSSAVSNKTVFIRSEQVKTKRLDDVLNDDEKSRVFLVKIDVEGMEYNVLKGAVKTLKSSQPYIIFEAWNEEKLEKVKRVLDNVFEYNLYRLDEVNYLVVPVTRSSTSSI